MKHYNNMRQWPFEGTPSAAHPQLIKRRSSRGASVTLMLLMVMAKAGAATLPTLIQDALHNYPSILEAEINLEAAQGETERERAAHWPTVGTEARQPVDTKEGRTFPIVTKLNLYAGGGIQDRIASGVSNEHTYEYKIDETREDVAYQVASAYLDGLAAYEQTKVAKRNFDRHQKIIDNLTIVVKYDGGKRSDLLQAQSRQLQVNTRMVQLESELRAATSKLEKYLSPDAVIDWAAPQNISDTPTDVEQHPTLLAQLFTEQKTRNDLEATKAARRPRLDLEAISGKNSTTFVALTWNFFDRATAQSASIASKTFQASQARTDEIRRTLNERINTAQVAVEQAQKGVVATKSQVVAAEQVSHAYEQQFLIARRALLDVLNSYSELSTVESAVVTAESSYRGALISLKFVNGQLAHWAQNAASL